MKYLLILSIILSISQSIYVQTTSYSKEFALNTGYNNPIGFIGAEVGIRPKMFNSITQYNIGFGFGSYQFLRFSQSINFYPLKEKRITPFLKLSLSESIKQDLNFEVNNVSSLYIVSSNFYISPTAAIRIKTKSDQISFNFFIGHSFLFNKPDIEFVYGDPTIMQKIKTKIIGRPILVFSISSLFY